MRSVCSLGAKDKMRFIEEKLSDGNPGICFSVTSMLEEGEELIYETRRHWAVLIPYLAAALLLSRATYGVSLMLILLPAFQIKTYEYAVTDRRLLVRQGMFRQEWLSILWEDAISVEILSEPLFGRIGMGTAVLRTKKGRLVLKYIEDAAAFAFYCKMTPLRGCF